MSSYIPIPDQANENDKIVPVDSRELPLGWEIHHDKKAGHDFYVDTLANPPKSVWLHPLDYYKLEKEEGVARLQLGSADQPKITKQVTYKPPAYPYAGVSKYQPGTLSPSESGGSLGEMKTDGSYGRAMGGIIPIDLGKGIQRVSNLFVPKKGTKADTSVHN